MSPADVFSPETEDRSFARDQMVRDWLRKPFKPEQIGKLPATPRRPALDFVGHAAVTDRLNRIAPDWTYTIDETFRDQVRPTPNGSVEEGKYWIRGTLTVGGVSRVEFGDGDDPKEAIGNFLRRAAMRFGVAIDLWSREELGSSGDGAMGRAADPSSGASSSGVDVPVRPEVKPEGKPKPSDYGEGSSDKATPPANLWDEARDLGLSPAKAVVAARKAGWDDVRSSTDLSDEQLRELIETRRKELV